jgi:prepilin-type N-terminal cleavage/methylation domain-containing protein
MRQSAHSLKGFTLLEVLVALVILGTGILGLTHGAALVSRLVGDGSRLTVAATVATARVEQLRALGCDRAASGTAVTRGIGEEWTVRPVASSGPPRALEVLISVTYRLRPFHEGDSARTQRFRGAVPCH